MASEDFTKKFSAGPQERSFFTQERLQNEKVVRVVYGIRGFTQNKQKLENIWALLNKTQNTPAFRTILRKIRATPDLHVANVSNISFNELWNTISNIHQAIERPGREMFHELFGRELLEEYQIERQLNPDDLSATTTNLLQDIDDILTLVECAMEALDLDVDREISPILRQKAEEEAVSEQKPAGTGGAPAIGIPIPEPQQEKDKREKEKEREKKELQKETVDSNRVLQADKLVRREIVRIQNAVLYQLATEYGITDEGKRDSFVEMLRSSASPVIVSQLYALNKDQFADAIIGTSDRLSLFTQTLLILQKDAAFQLALQKTLSDKSFAIPEDRAKKPIDLQAAANAIDQAIKSDSDGQNHKAVIEKIRTALGIDEKTVIGEYRNASASAFEGDLTKLLRDAGVDSGDIQKILIKLQTMAISGANFHTLDEKQFRELFMQFLSGADADRVRQQIRGLDSRNERWAQYFTSYIHLLQTTTYDETRNSAVFGRSGVPVQGLGEIEKDIARLGPRVVALGMYERQQLLLGKAQTQSSLEIKKIFERAIEYKNQKKEALQRLQQIPTAQRKVFLQQYAQTFGFSQEFTQYFEASDAIFEQQWMQWIEQWEYYFVPAELPEQLDAQAASQQSFLSNLATRVQANQPSELEQQVAKQALYGLLTVLGGAAAIPALEKLLKIPIVGDVLSAFIMDAWKKVKYILAALGAMLGLLLLPLIQALMAAGAAVGNVVAAWNGAKILGKSLGGGLQSFASGANILGKSIATATKSVFANLGAGFGTALPGMSVATVITVITYQIATASPAELFMVNVSGVRGGRGVVGCWPTSGIITTTDYYLDKNGYPTDRHGMDGPLYHADSGKTFEGPGTAIDIGTEQEERPIYSPFGGTAYYYPEGSGIHKDFGNHVVLITEDESMLIIFGHFASFGAQNAEVKVGDLLGMADSTGKSTGPHLHYEVFGANIQDIIPDPEVKLGQEVTSECDPGVQPSGIQALPKETTP